MMRALLATAFALGLAATAEAGQLVLREAEFPPVSYTTRDGAAQTPADLGGKLTLVHLWASWCGSCRTEFPALDAMQEEMRAEGLRVAAVSIDRLGWPVVDRTTESLGIRHVAVFLDQNRDLVQKLGVTGLPTTIVVDERGREVARLIGSGDWASAELRDKLRGLMRR